MLGMRSHPSVSISLIIAFLVLSTTAVAQDPGCRNGTWELDEFCGVDAKTATGEAEMNHDCVLDFLDLTRMYGQVGLEGQELSGDFNGDGYVTIADIGTFSASYLSGNPVTPCIPNPETPDYCGSNLSLSLDPNIIVSRGRQTVTPPYPFLVVYVMVSDWLDAGAIEYAFVTSSNVTIAAHTFLGDWTGMDSADDGFKHYYAGNSIGFPQASTTLVAELWVMITDSQPATLELVDYGGSGPPRGTRWSSQNLDHRTEFLVRRNVGINMEDPVSTSGCLSTNQSPTLVINDPSSDIEATTCIYNVSGSATDTDGSIAFVEYRVNDGSWLPASGTNIWTASISLESGENWIQVRAADDEGAYSSTQTVSIDNPLPTITSIVDVENDQGRRVRLNLLASSRDVLGSPTPILQYEAFRRIDPLPTGATRGPALPVEGIQMSDPQKMAGWEFVGAVPAHGNLEYNMIVPTLADKTPEEIHWSVFFVRAATAQPLVYFDSCSESGYSVDNLAPSVPNSLVVAYAAAGNQLSWEQCPEEDFRYFRIYRGTTPDFVPGEGNLVEATTSIDWLDDSGDSWSYFYKVSAVDFAGNESEAGSPSEVTGVQDGTVPMKTALLDAVPNPFNPTTRLSFEMAASGHARLQVYDTAGRLVVTLVDEQQGPGIHHIIWDGRDSTGRMSSAGVYLYRLEAAGIVETKRMTLVK